LNTNSEQYKQQVYKKWLAGDRAFYHIDPKKEPTPEERKIIQEMSERENARANRKIELEKRAAEIKRKRRVNQVKEFDRLMRGFQ
jgi:hypothetical protein